MALAAAGDSIPRLVYAFPGCLLERGAAGAATEGVNSTIGRNDPGRVLADKVSVMLYDHQKRTERRGYEHEMLFGEAARLLAVSGKQQEGLRMQYFRWVQKGFSEWVKGNMEACAQGFAAAADMLANVFSTEVEPGPTAAVLERAAISLRAMILVAKGRRALELSQSAVEDDFSDGNAHESDGLVMLTEGIDLLKDLLQSQRQFVSLDTDKGVRNLISSLDDLVSRTRRRNQMMKTEEALLEGVREEEEGKSHSSGEEGSGASAKSRVSDIHGRRRPRQ